MCGILFHLRTRPPQASLPEPIDTLNTLIQARGPDGFQTVQRTIPFSKSETHLTFSASVLALRGSTTVLQPLVDEATKSLLMWNGEAWKLYGQTLTENDTQCIFEALLKNLALCGDEASRASVIRDVLASVSGPFAFCFYDAPAGKVYYGRDPLGRRSLVKSSTADGDISLASVSDAKPESKWEEVATGGIHGINLDGAEGNAMLDETIITWRSAEDSCLHLNRDVDIPEGVSLPSLTTMAELEHRLQDSVSLRTTATATWLKSSSNHSHFAVLFSGGIDCTLLAYMLDRVLPADHTIDLLNVAFENPRVLAAASKQGKKGANLGAAHHDSAYDNCPDRRTGLSSYGELCRICPLRKWQFVAVNVPYAVTTAYTALVASLMYPHCTEMDLSISLALFFASRGEGEVSSVHGSKQYVTSAKVLFSGLGADELFAGYTRHSKAFSYSGLQGLLSELDLDFKRLGQRNLGRDDRIVSYWGREIRYPYLDEEFTAWALQKPIWEKCGFGYGPTNGSVSLGSDKLTLRIVASRLGLEIAATEKKRAIQFGARTAKMTIGRTKGTDSIVV